MPTFAQMGNMGVELFPWNGCSPSYCFLSGLALYGTGLVVSVFETALNTSTAVAAKDTALNALKGFMAVSL